MTFTTLVSQRSFAESPRWRQGYLYYSDFYRQVVERVDLQGQIETVAQVPTQPSGLGWLPTGELLVVSMLDRKVLKQRANGDLVEHADLSAIATGHCNDMVVANDGTAYVGNFGFDSDNEKPKAAQLAVVTPQGDATAAQPALKFPNGSVISPDGKTLIVAETMGRRLSAFDISANGALSNHRTWAPLGRHFADGICMDAQGGIWIADPVRAVLIRVLEGGEITHQLNPGRPAYACMLGGADGKRLFACTGLHSGSAAANSTTAQIDYVDVDIPGAGWPSYLN